MRSIEYLALSTNCINKPVIDEWCGHSSFFNSQGIFWQLFEASSTWNPSQCKKGELKKLLPITGKHASKCANVAPFTLSTYHHHHVACQMAQASMAHHRSWSLVAGINSVNDILPCHYLEITQIKRESFQMVKAETNIKKITTIDVIP